ncbi:MAG: hypothetical protein AAB737_02245 [Patescibacteria group bacterium]
MDNFLKMDIFFVVATLATTVLSVLLTMVLLRVLGILKKIDEVTALVRGEGEQLREDIQNVREHVHKEGLRIGHLFGFLSGMKKRKTRTKRS